MGEFGFSSSYKVAKRYIFKKQNLFTVDLNVWFVLGIEKRNNLVK